MGLAAEIAVRRAAGRSWNPLRVSGTELPANVLLMAKLLALCFGVSGGWHGLPDHFLPFLSVFDKAGSPEVFQRTLQLIFFAAAASLLFNFHVRTACFVLGALILTAILSSRVYFENNRMYMGCLWLMAGLQPASGKPVLLRLQVVLLYLGAGLNKLLDPGWRSGEFFETMVVRIGHQPLYIWLSSLLPPLWLSKLMCWAVVATELSLATGLLLRRFLGPVIWIGIAFHTMLLWTMRSTFGMFYCATLSSFLLFVDLPLPRSIVYCPPHPDRGIWPFLRFLDFDRLFEFKPACENPAVPGMGGLRTGSDLYTGIGAWYRAFMCSPLTYFAFAVTMYLPLPNSTYFRDVVALLILLFFSPALLRRAGRPVWTPRRSNRASGCAASRGG